MGYREDRSETGLVETLKTQAQGNHPAAICHTLSQSVTIFLLQIPAPEKENQSVRFFFFWHLKFHPMVFSLKLYFNTNREKLMKL